MALPGLDRDSITHKRPATTADTEGNATLTLSTVATIAGTWGSPGARDLALAAQNGQSLEAVIATAATGIQTGDILVCRGRSWEVVAVTDARFHSRCFVRKAEQ